ncbi:LOW QUALITY PROTEIN: hypothetical protein CVT25_005293 [Psilocybe cyanescens]|uniref:Uncharacterized protein n=1 Tax=Psilocybe cyanescens TaxID=93625 RepID=A0A409XRX9_PSICY|nr:LOW QUALITY PROTEIN: hypothetical protein CVT25_005293 [Psilocybe cyanescens]
MATLENKSMHLLISFSAIKNRRPQIVETLGLIDSRAGGKFIDQNYTRKLGLEQKTLKKNLTVYNVDGTLNKKGMISTFVELNLTIGNRTNKEILFVSGLGRQKIILGLPWLQKRNPNIDWETGKVKWRVSKSICTTTMEEELEETEPIMDITNTTDTPLEDFNALILLK